MAEASRKQINVPALETDPEVVLVARVMLAALLSLPAGSKRAAAVRLLGEHVKPKTQPKAPQRGGSTLSNVVRLFKEDRRPEWTAEQIFSELERRGQQPEKKSLYNALTYLSSDPTKRILRKVGYGRYQLADGSWIEGPP